jgi:hypothetical protein
MVHFDFGKNSLGIRDVRMVTLNVKRCIHKYVPEPAVVLAMHLHNQLQQLHLLQLQMCLPKLLLPLPLLQTPSRILRSRQHLLQKTQLAVPKSTRNFQLNPSPTATVGDPPKIRRLHGTSFR